jgi:hypothetical protein
MNPWLQTKQYHCPACGERYLHDKAYHHALFRCPARRMPAATLPTTNGSTP